MNVSKILIVSLFFFLNTNIVLSSEKIAFINIDKVLKNSSYGKSLLSDIQKINEKNIEKLKNNEIILKKKEDDLNKKKNIISKEEFENKLSALKKEIILYRSEKDKMINEIENKRKDSLNSFFSKINPIIQDYLDENSISLLFEQKNIFIGKNSLDITDEIVNKIDKNLNND